MQYSDFVTASGWSKLLSRSCLRSSQISIVTELDRENFSSIPKDRTSNVVSGEPPIRHSGHLGFSNQVAAPDIRQATPNAWENVIRFFLRRKPALCHTFGKLSEFLLHLDSSSYKSLDMERPPLRLLLGILLLGCACSTCVTAAETGSSGDPSTGKSGLKIVIIVGSGGTETFAEEFAKAAGLWKAAAEKGGAECELIGLDAQEDGEPSDAEKLRKSLAVTTSSELWIVLIGHGTFDQREIRFNMRGPDITDRELSSWLDTYSGRHAVINTASASGSFIRSLSRENRIVITATKNEGEQNYTRFGRFFVEAIAGAESADVDNDGQVSLLEAFLFASGRVVAFYKDEARIATEHALIDDNGDRLGSRAEWFQGITPTQAPSPKSQTDGDLASQKVLVKSDFERRFTEEQRHNRDRLERDVVALRRAKADTPEADYYKKLEPLLLELARLYESVKGDHP